MLTLTTVAKDLRMSKQARTVLLHMRNHEHISPMEALMVYSISRLAACVYEIRKAGYKVHSQFVRDDAGHKYTKYSLVKVLH